MRALVVTNMWPTEDNPALGSFVRDQVEALRALEDVEIELFTFPPGLRSYPRAARELRRRYRGRDFDVIHSHFGLTAWPALALRGAPHLATLHGNDLYHPRSNRVTRAAMRLGTWPAPVSRTLARELPGAGRTRAATVLPCGIDLGRFSRIDRHAARERLGRDPQKPFVLFPHDPARRPKRHDRAAEVAQAAGVELHSLGRTPPQEVPLWINAAAAVLVPSEFEGFGLAVIEALACDVPVLATDVGIHPVALHGIPGVHCGPYELRTWRAALSKQLEDPDPRVPGRRRAEIFSAARMAARVRAAWAELVAR